MKRNRIIKTKLAIVVSLFLLSIMAIDSDSIVPMIISGLCLVWLILFMIANTRG